jgi:hypothetical protein
LVQGAVQLGAAIEDDPALVERPSRLAGHVPQPKSEITDLPPASGMSLGFATGTDKKSLLPMSGEVSGLMKVTRRVTRTEELTKGGQLHDFRSW